MSDVKSINDISYILEGEKIVGVSDDRTGLSISKIPGNIVVGTTVIPEKLANNLFIAWLLLSDPEIIKPDDPIPRELSNLLGACIDKRINIESQIRLYTENEREPNQAGYESIFSLGKERELLVQKIEALQELKHDIEKNSKRG